MSVKELLQLHGELMFVKNGTDKESLEQYMKVHEKSKIVDQKLFNKRSRISSWFSTANGHVERLTGIGSLDFHPASSSKPRTQRTKW